MVEEYMALEGQGGEAKQRHQDYSKSWCLSQWFLVQKCRAGITPNPVRWLQALLLRCR